MKLLAKYCYFEKNPEEGRYNVPTILIYQTQVHKTNFDFSKVVSAYNWFQSWYLNKVELRIYVLQDWVFMIPQNKVEHSWTILWSYITIVWLKSVSYIVGEWSISFP